MLRRHRQATGLTQEELAARAQLSSRAISDLERGVKRAPQWATVDLLIGALALPPAEVTRFRAAARPRLVQSPGDEQGPMPTQPPLPDIRYASNVHISIAYQVIGNGPHDLLATPGALSHLEYMWEEPGAARYLRGLAAFCRLLLFDKRGTGMSDRAGDGIPTLEERIDDMRAVMDAAGSQRAALLGWSEGGPMSILFAATYPERTSALILYGAYARNHWAPDYPWRSAKPTAEELVQREQEIRSRWGTREYSLAMLQRFAPTMIGNAAFERWWCAILRLGASPGAWLALGQMNREMDVRDILPSIRVPTLVLHRRGERIAELGNAHYLAEHIPGAQLVELPGDDHLPWVGDSDAILREIERFLAGQAPREEPPDRLLATILRLEVVPHQPAGQGDQRQPLAQDAGLRQALARYRGRQLAGSGSELVAAFDGPARAIRCAGAIREALMDRRVAVRAGVHAGECDVTGDTLTGLPLEVTARMVRQATAGSILVTSTVRDLVNGSGFRFRAVAPLPATGPEHGRQLFIVEQALAS
jgi:pimeloyl-ACP methyl ester carboxylesterase/DNA-binding XRE family transcriptional regulator